MATIDGSNLRWVPDDRVIGRKALWTLRLVFGAYSAWLIFLAGGVVATGSTDGLAYLFGQMLGVAALYWGGLRLMSGIQTPSGDGQNRITKEEVDFENASVAEAVVGNEPGDILTDREIKREADEDDKWWAETAKPQLKGSDHIEQADSTGRRWKVLKQDS